METDDVPELPEVETVRRALRPHLRGRGITAVRARVDRLRRPVQTDDLRAACVGHRFVDIRRRAKYLIAELDGPRSLLLHLGMTGAFRIEPADTPDGDYDRVIWDLDNGQVLRFTDVRRFGTVVTCATSPAGIDPPELPGLGPEPLGPEFHSDHLHAVTRGRTRPIKNLLMDQAVVVGIGNIYANEALFRARINPRRQAGRLSHGSCGRLVHCVREVLREAIEAGGTTISDFRSVDGSEGKFRIHLDVYDRTGRPCSRCADDPPVRRIVQAGRSTYYCPRCQH